MFNLNSFGGSSQNVGVCLKGAVNCLTISFHVSFLL